VLFEHIEQLAPKPASWITPPSNAGAFPELAEMTELGTGMPNSGEQQLCPGLIPLAAVALGLVVVIRPGPLGGRGSAVAVAALSAALIGLLVTHYGVMWCYEPIARLPGVSGIRALGRVVMVLLFPAAVVMAAGADLALSAARRWGQVPAILVALLAFTGTAADQWLTRVDGPRAADWAPLRCSLDVTLWRQDRIAEAVRRHPAPTLVYAFPAAGTGQGGSIALQLEAVRVAQDYGLPCVNGWSGHWPHSWTFFPNYRALMNWLTVTNSVPANRLAGLVIIGEPNPDLDPSYETGMRAAHPPQPGP
jgi:hypothetical protein